MSDQNSNAIHEMRKGRNLWVGLLLGGFVVVVFAVTVVKLASGENFRGEPRTPVAPNNFVDEK